MFAAKQRRQRASFVGTYFATLVVQRDDLAHRSKTKISIVVDIAALLYASLS